MKENRGFFLVSNFPQLLCVGGANASVFFSMSSHRLARPPASYSPHSYFLKSILFEEFVFSMRFSIFTFPFLLPSSLIDTRRRWWSFHFRKEMEFFDEAAIGGRRGKIEHRNRWENWKTMNQICERGKNRDSVVVSLFICWISPLAGRRGECQNQCRQDRRKKRPKWREFRRNSIIIICRWFLLQSRHSSTFLCFAHLFGERFVAIHFTYFARLPMQYVRQTTSNRGQEKIGSNFSFSSKKAQMWEGGVSNLQRQRSIPADYPNS